MNPDLAGCAFGILPLPISIAHLGRTANAATVAGIRSEVKGVVHAFSADGLSPTAPYVHSTFMPVRMESVVAITAFEGQNKGPRVCNHGEPSEQMTSGD
jgi:hypothetical protein